MTLHPGVEFSREIDREEHLTLATLDCRLKITKDVCHPLAHLVAKVNNSEYVLCFLEKGITHQQSLDFVFQKGDKLVLIVEGNAVVHITGYSMRDSIYEDNQQCDNNGIPILEAVSPARVQGDQNSTLFFEEQIEFYDENCSSREGGQHEGHSREPSVKLESYEESHESHRTTEGSLEWEDNGATTSSLQISAGDFNHFQRANGREMDFSNQNLHENLGVFSRGHANPTEVHNDSRKEEIELEIAEDNMTGNQIDSNCVLQESNLRGKCRSSEKHTGYQPRFEWEVTENSRQNKDYRLLYQDVPVLSKNSELVKFHSYKFPESNSHFSNSNVVEEYLERSRLHGSSDQVTNNCRNEEEDIMDLEPKEQSVDPTCKSCLKTGEHESNQEVEMSEEDENGTTAIHTGGKTSFGNTQKFALKVPSRRLKSPGVKAATHGQQNKTNQPKAAEGDVTGNNKTASTVDNKYLCHVCGILNTGASRLQAHEKTQGTKESLVCQFCGKLLHQRIQMVLHEVKHHTGKKAYKSYSPKSFTMREHNLKEKTVNPHISSQCQIPSQKCITKENSLPFKKTYKGGRPFQCQYCPKPFKAQHHLDQHLRTHTGEKPFPCRFCNKPFRQKSHRTQHEKLHSREKYKCKLCDQNFISKSDVRRHEKQCMTVASAVNYPTHIDQTEFITKDR